MAALHRIFPSRIRTGTLRLCCGFLFAVAMLATVTPATAAVSISVSPVTATLVALQARSFSASISGATNSGVSWSATCGTFSSSTANPVTYTAPAAAGTCTLTAKAKADATKSAQATVTVVPAVSVSVTPATASLLTKGTQSFTAKVENSTNTAVTWAATCGSLSSTAANPVTYTAPAAAGACTVTATSKADTTKTAKATVTVSLPVAISLTPTTASLLAQGTQKFTATVTNTTNTAVNWTASCGSLSSTTANPVTYTAPATAATCTVTAASAADSSKTAKATVTVTLPVGISVSPATASLLTKGTQAFTAKVENSTVTAVTWSASCGTLSSVTANPVTYTAPATAGSCTVTATAKADTTKTAKATVTVTAPPPVTISVSPTSASLLTKATQSFTATVTNSTNTAVTWTATCGTFASTTANPATYAAPATAATCTVTATAKADTTKTAKATVTVTAPPPVTVAVSPTTAALQTGATQSFTATVTNATNTAVTWSATCGALAGTAANPVTYTAPASAGSCTVTATSQADTTKSAKATVTVTAKPVNVTVTPATASLFTGATQVFTAKVENSTNTAVTWSASCGALSNAAAASVTYTAPATASTCTVTAASVAAPTRSASAIVTVTLPPPVTVTVSPATASLQTGATQSFTAAVGNTTNTAVTWSASCGALSSTTANPVTYTAPSTAGTCTVTATSKADATKSAAAAVTVTAPQSVSVSISPSSASLQTGGTQVFTATVTGSTNTAVGWSASCGTLSSISANPVTYTAPATAGSCTVTATSAADATQSAQAVVTVGSTQTITISISPASASIPIGGIAQFTATVSGSTNTGVTWSAGWQGGTITGTGNTIQFTNTSPGITTLTATANADSNQAARADILVVPAGQTYPAVPYPIADHPRLYMTPADVTRLQGWVSDSNPMYSQGLQPVLQSALRDYTTQFFPGGQQNPSWPDAGDVQGYQLPLAEEDALVLAFNAQVDPDPAKRILYAQYARNLIMYPLSQAALGHQANAPYRDPAFAVYNRGSGSGQNWPLVVDWIYNIKDANGNYILTAADKATVRSVFLLWAADCITANTTGGDSPQVQGVLNDPQLLPNNLPYRMASNNYYLAHAKLLTLMSLVMDPSDDPPVSATEPATQLGNTLRSYLSDANGAWLYQEYAMMGDAQTVASAYGIPGNGAGFGLASGGLPPEGMLYGESFGTLLGQLLALQTSGFNNSAYAAFNGPQIGLIGAPVWGRWVNGMISSLIPSSFVAPSEPYLGPVYEYAGYGDMLRLWVEPDNVNGFTLLDLLENENGQTTHQADVRWFATNVLQGGAEGIAARMTSSTWGAINSLWYFMLFDPAAQPATDPRPTFPLEFYDPGAGRIVAHSDWTPNGTLFDYHASWESINHQDGNAGEFEMYRKGEWLTKEMSNYDNNGVGMTSYYHNSLALKNACPAGTPSLGWDETGIWANGGQWMWGANAGDPTTITSNGKAYVYAATDMTGLYNRPDPWDDSLSVVDITRAQRSVFWLNNDYIVIYDRATSKSSGLFKRFNLSLVNNPTLNGQNATETMDDGQQLFIHTLLPLNASIAAREADTDLQPVADLEPTRYVMTVEDTSNPTDIRFLHVLQGADQGTTATAVSGFSSTSGTAFDGALAGNTALLFLHDDTQAASFTSTVYSVPSTVTANYVAGLVPNAAYTVLKTAGANTFQITVTAGGSSHADAAGVLVF